MYTNPQGNLTKYSINPAPNQKKKKKKVKKNGITVLSNSQPIRVTCTMI